MADGGKVAVTERRVDNGGVKSCWKLQLLTFNPIFVDNSDQQSHASIRRHPFHHLMTRTPSNRRARKQTEAPTSDRLFDLVQNGRF